MFTRWRISAVFQFECKEKQFVLFPAWQVHAECESLLSAAMAMDGESFLIPFYRIEGIRLLYCTASIIAIEYYFIPILYIEIKRRCSIP